jgi:capsular polysaccharide transport system permease protein
MRCAATDAMTSGRGVNTLDRDARMRTESKIKVQARVVFALVMREMSTRYGRTAGGYVWAVIEPITFIAMMSVIFSAISRRPPLGDSFPLFFASGYLSFHAYRDISEAVSGAVQFNRPLLSFPRVTPLDTMIARFILQFLTSCFIIGLIMGTLLLVVDEQVRVDPAPIVASLALMALLAVGVASINCVLFSYSPTWRQLFQLINRPLFLISGVLFLYEDLPSIVQGVLWWNPLIHIVSLMRSGFYATYDAGFVSEIYVVGVSAGPLLIGVLLLRAMRGEILEQ